MHIKAPGVDILSDGIQNNRAVLTDTGTSMAAAVVSGAAAVVWAMAGPKADYMIIK